MWTLCVDPVLKTGIAKPALALAHFTRSDRARETKGETESEAVWTQAGTSMSQSKTQLHHELLHHRGGGGEAAGGGGRQRNTVARWWW